MTCPLCREPVDVEGRAFHLILVHGWSPPRQWDEELKRILTNPELRFMRRGRTLAEADA